jgi:hypothetical protein
MDLQWPKRGYPMYGYFGLTGPEAASIGKVHQLHGRPPEMARARVAITALPSVRRSTE